MKDQMVKRKSVVSKTVRLTIDLFLLRPSARISRRGEAKIPDRFIERVSSAVEESMEIGAVLPNPGAISNRCPFFFEGHIKISNIFSLSTLSRFRHPVFS